MQVNPTLQLQRDLALVGHMEELGFDECWYVTRAADPALVLQA